MAHILIKTRRDGVECYFFVADSGDVVHSSYDKEGIARWAEGYHGSAVPFRRVPTGCDGLAR